jgi:hypothetical protein
MLVFIVNPNVADAAWSVKKLIEPYIQQNGMTIHSIMPRVSVENRPEMQSKINKGGKCLGVLERAGVRGLVPEWSPVKIYSDALGRPTLLAQWDEATNKWTLQSEALVAVGCQRSVQDLLADLTE